MHILKKLAIATATVGFIALSPLAATAADGDLSRQLTEARQEGSLWTAFALNRHLSPFSIDVDVEHGVATLTGTVESSVDRDLAEQLALGVEGITKVDNQLEVKGDKTEQRKYKSGERSFSSRFNDSTTTATVKSKLLWNQNTEGLDIKVTTVDGVVTLEGTADSAAASDLATRLARNTSGVRQVTNKLQVTGNSKPTITDKAKATTSQAEEVISDAWITSKVKSSYLLSSNLDGMDIKVDTQNGQVTLSGVAGSAAEKDLAVETAKNIRGVRAVKADGLRVAP